MVAPAKKVITVRVTPQQYAALREEATRRAVQTGGAADASAIIRELLDRWIEDTKGKKRSK
jgi:Arc/MetJ-type ribon-helix-helix transcriptional regulator